MKIGYACLTVGVAETNFKSCIMRNANEENLKKIINHNLRVLDRIIDYNIENNIKLFRIGSDIIPFGSSDVNFLEWWKIFSEKLSLIGEKIRKSKMRVSMHPGQYTVLNSIREDVILNSIGDLEYHNKFLASLGVNKKNKIIIHIGGVYGDKESAINRFVNNYKTLSDEIKDRLVIENDDKSYNIKDVLDISKAIGAPVVYDNLHNKVLPYDITKTDEDWIKLCAKTWKADDGIQKIHYSQQDKDKRPGAHSLRINLGRFLDFIEDIKLNVDIMLEVKDKNLSAIKCNNGISSEKKIKTLELEWSKYKYYILEHSASDYQMIRTILKEKASYPVLEFYQTIDRALNTDKTIGGINNALHHVWGYFKNIAIEEEKVRFFKLLKSFEEGKKTIKPLKKLLLELALKYKKDYLINSYYFYID